ncbi:MAG: ribosomal protein L3 N(5)-glutamine methyltransferase [gamma proteobacterium symbiont of Ctena orbiculata]|nr:MAG: ribosomal protein L3 N(5)-glutamine methyltransferase [gamma proteobacterium symbiont of Ctena orbiculata]PVV20434.1 MAG: ribosomal protein L3 N(5)-glutamine methyltransferase [gamma proteobacterium symbiont of Ctena orbiculata]PVV26425.1 MAG: ribosomal protein L3 N(5)-glutamine methyltransferase [gamma proteobacterium symbiont of Ctena orbiculata]
MQTLISIADFIRWGASRFSEAGLFFGHGTDNALDEAAALVLGALHLPPDLPASWFGSRLTAPERQRVLDLIQRRIDERMPLPYLLGEAWFAGMRFHVNEQVLIPRSPIAELIETGFAPWLEPSPKPQILDLCCGSGCIGIAAAAYLPESRVDLVDISADVLQVAKRNIAEYGLQERVTSYTSDLFETLPDKQYDLIVSNPPYVGLAEMEALPHEYRHEPVLALQANENGLEIVQRILKQARRYLTPRGILIVEVGNSARLLVDRYPQMPFVWLDFERGGEGVFLLSAADLAE